MSRKVVQWLLCVFVALATTPAWAVEPELITLEEEPAADTQTAREAIKKKTPAKKKKKTRRKKPKKVEEVVIEEPAPEPVKKRPPPPPPPPREEVVDPGGLECSPAVSQVEVRRPIPISCGVTRNGVSSIEIRYKTPDKKKFTKVVLVKAGSEWTGEIPCTATAKRGEMKISFSARNAADRLVAKIDAVSIQLVEQTSEPPPSFPGKDPPMRCYDAAECPPEFKGTPACPGTKGASGIARKGWGGSCTSSAECQPAFACVNGTCEQAPKCDVTADCPTGGECDDGICTFLDPEELASRLSDPKVNWIGVHFGLDSTIVPAAVGVCGKESDDHEDYSCFQGGDPYEGPPNVAYAGNVKSGFRMATMRIMASYERWFGRFAAGARVGFAFGGAPEGFNPLHLEARVLYALRKEPLTRRGRPYLGLVGGLAQVDPRSTLTLIDCSEGPSDCETGKLEELGMLGARELKVDTYRKGSKLFFGPALGYIYAFTNAHAVQFNLNVMFPDVVLEPSIGYVFGL